MRKFTSRSEHKADYEIYALKELAMNRAKYAGEKFFVKFAMNRAKYAFSNVSTRPPIVNRDGTHSLDLLGARQVESTTFMTYSGHESWHLPLS